MELATALTEVLNDIELAQELGRNGRYAVETKFSLKAISRVCSKSTKTLKIPAS